jgi:hypothetical protein
MIQYLDSATNNKDVKRISYSNKARFKSILDSIQIIGNIQKISFMNYNNYILLYHYSFPGVHEQLIPNSSFFRSKVYVLLPSHFFIKIICYDNVCFTVLQ